MDLLYTHASITSCITHLEYIGSLSCIDLPNVDPFHFTMSKKSVLALVPSEESLKLGSCETHMFSKILTYN